MKRKEAQVNVRDDHLSRAKEKTMGHGRESSKKTDCDKHNRRAKRVKSCQRYRAAREKEKKRGV